jgi:hypothetical protein
MLSGKSASSRWESAFGSSSGCIRLCSQGKPTESWYQLHMGFSFAFGNHGVREPKLQKKLMKHFHVAARHIATAGRQFPITARIDIQSGIEGLLNRRSEAELVGLFTPNSHEPLTFAQMLGGPTSLQILVLCNMTRWISARPHPSDA